MHVTAARQVQAVICYSSNVKMQSVSNNAAVTAASTLIYSAPAGLIAASRISASSTSVVLKNIFQQSLPLCVTTEG